MRALGFLVLAIVLAACGSSPSGAGGGAGGGGASGGGAGGGGGGGAAGGGGGSDAGAGGGSGGGTGGGAGGGAGGGFDGGQDAGSGDAGIPFEQEPNDGAAAGELDSITAPGAKQGAIGTANDVDIFTVTLTAGQQWRWRVDANGSPLIGHLSVTEAQNTVPILVARAAAGAPVDLEQLVLKSGTYAIIVRDSRNVPASSSQNVGSPQHAYVVSGVVSTRTPVPVAVPGTANGTLANRYASAIHSFTLSAPTAVTLRALAKTKSPASDLDTRLTLFNATTNQWGGTNDDAAGLGTDSKLSGMLTPGDYRVVIDNVSETAVDLTYQLSLTSP